jgi:3D (Asp-Asp-Asp) domain-containing protein
MLHSQARQSSKHSPAAIIHLRTRPGCWQRINSTNYTYFGKYELMAIMLIGVCIEETRGGIKINFDKKSLIPHDESILPHETRVQVLNILILFNVTFER